MVLPGPIYDALGLTITRSDVVGNDLLDMFGETAVYSLVYEWDSGLTSSTEEDGWSVSAPYELVLTLDSTCGHTWKNLNDMCTNV